MFNDQQMLAIKNIMSSYNKNKETPSRNYGNIFYSLTTLCDPKIAVEIGVCKGYSTIHIAKGIKDCNSGGKLTCFDLWESDSLKTNFHEGQIGLHLTSSKEEVKNLLIHLDLDNQVDLKTAEAFDALNEFKDESVDIIHIDIGNCGNVLDKIIPIVFCKLRKNGYFLYEGGAKYRDNVSWMTKFNKKPIFDSLVNSSYFKERFQYVTLEEYPSLTLCKKVLHL